MAGVGELVLANVCAELVTGVLGFGRGLNGRVDLIAHLLPDGRGLIESGVVAAGVEGDSEVEDGFAGLEADLRTGGIDERGRLLDLGLDRSGRGGGRGGLLLR